MPPDENANTGFGSSFPVGCQPGMVRLNAFVDANFGGTSLGCFSATSRMSSGAWSWHKYGKAIDRGFNWYDQAGRAKGKLLFNWYIAHAEELGLQQTIFGDEIWDVAYGLRAYHHDDHKNHVHAAFSYAASQNWRPSAAPLPEVEVDEIQLQRMIGGIQDGEKYAANMVIGALKPLLDQVEALLVAANATLVEVRKETAAVKRNTQPAP